MMEEAKMNHIANAVEPLRTKAIEKAVEIANGQISKIISLLEENDFNSDAFAPFPDSRYPSNYKEKLELYKFVHSITDSVKCVLNIGEPNIRKISKAKEEHYIKRVKEEASFIFDKFIFKLTDKIGDVDEASLFGNFIWDYSVLTVVKNGKTEYWKTRSIFNTSKYGKVFMQFPTRKVKGKEAK